MSNTEKFTVDVTGDFTGKTWKGVFATKVRLSHRDQFRQDEIRRDMLGKNPDTASPRAQNSAEVFSFVLAHLVDAPQWWTVNGNGLDMEDDNVVAEIYVKIVDIKLAAQNKLKADAEAARKELEEVGK